MKSSLNVVGWNAELLLKDRAGKLNDKQRRLVSEIIKAQEKLVAMIKEGL